MKGLLLFLTLFLSFTSSQTVQQSLATNDIKALNFALTLEHLEANFYRTFLNKYNRSDFESSGYGSEVYAYVQIISAHEDAHVSALNSTIVSLGGSPVRPCTYNFTNLDSVTSFLATARILENTGVSAYDGAVAAVTSDVYKVVAATIATVEARHAAYLNELNSIVPFPASFDPALSPASVRALVLPFLSSCPDTLDLPQILDCLTATPISDPYVIPNITLAGYQNSPRQRALLENDIVALNYALTLENLEATFYRRYLDQFSMRNFSDAGFNATVYAYFGIVSAHEDAHVAALTSVITSFGGVAVNATQCTYTFPVNNVTDFVTVARLLENTGVSAYDGAINTIFNTALRTTAATIATVEARHAAYLNQILYMVPFPNITDTALTPTQIAAAVRPFLSCSYTIQLPQVEGCGNVTTTGGSGSSGSNSGTNPTSGSNPITGSSGPNNQNDSGAITVAVGVFTLFTILLFI